VVPGKGEAEWSDGKVESDESINTLPGAMTWGIVLDNSPFSRQRCSWGEKGGGKKNPIQTLLSKLINAHGCVKEIASRLHSILGKALSLKVWKVERCVEGSGAAGTDEGEGRLEEAISLVPKFRQPLGLKSAGRGGKRGSNPSSSQSVGERENHGNNGQLTLDWKWTGGAAACLVASLGGKGGRLMYVNNRPQSPRERILNHSRNTQYQGKSDASSPPSNGV